MWWVTWDAGAACMGMPNTRAHSPPPSVVLDVRRRCLLQPDVPPGRAQADEFELNSRIGAVQTAVHAALCDNLDTAAALDALSELIKAVNVYLAKKEVRAALCAV